MFPGSADREFAEHSSPQHCIKRGHEFMKLMNYNMAETCFIEGEDKHYAKIAKAYKHTQTALKTKDRHYFMLAAEIFIECDMLPQAVNCLQNANERELQAQLCEKYGQVQF